MSGPYGRPAHRRSKPAARIAEPGLLRRSTRSISFPIRSERSSSGLADSAGKSLRAGIGDLSTKLSPPVAPWPAPPPLRIAVLGNHARNKGADTLVWDRRSNWRRQLPFPHRRGRSRRNTRPVLAALPAQRRRTARSLRAGTSRRHLCGGCHVALFASPWPETFLLTLSEAMQAGARARGPGPGGLRRTRPRRGKRPRRARGRRLLRPCPAGPAGRSVVAGKAQGGRAGTRVPTLDEDAAGFERLYDGLAAEYGLPGASFPVALQVGNVRSDRCGPGRRRRLQPGGQIDSGEGDVRIYKTQGARMPCFAAHGNGPPPGSARVNNASERGG